MSTITTSPHLPLQALDALSDPEREQLWTWNRTVPSALERCVHDIIDDQIKLRPSAPAVCAWDGELRYGELDHKSNQLAHHLVESGVKPHDVVALCFEKSVWTTVAVLAVLKAGAVFLMIDPSHPESRLRSIVNKAAVRVIVSSTSSLSLSSRLADTVIVLCSSPVSDTTGSCVLPQISPLSPMYVVFTSGSTGEPKGVLVSHQAFASNIHHQASALGFKSDSRVFDFATHIFDVFVYNTIATLATGGCLCVPSEWDRKNNLAGSLASMKATLVDLTPSVSRLLNPDDVPSLKSLKLGGEALTLEDATKWWRKAEIMNVYGPSECTTHSLINCNAPSPAEAVHLGRGAGMLTWVVNPADHNKLMPIGTVGELLLEGPLLGLGYLNDPERNSATYIHNPPWLVAGAANHTGRHGILYKTGDMVRYNKDGTLSYMGRKDTQVKIRGQRVELGEVEHNVRAHVPQARDSDQVVAEVIVPSGEPAQPLLAVFLSASGDTQEMENRTNGENVDMRILAVAEDSEDRLAEHLPTYMVPSAFFTVSRMPMTATGKTDRRQLRQTAGAFSRRQLADARSEAEGGRQKPSTAVERQLQQLWAQVLKIDAQSISSNDTFFRLGGDSITAMKLVSNARQEGLAVSVMDIFRHPRLTALARSIANQTSVVNKEISPFALLPSQFSSSEHVSAIAARCGVDASQVEDAYPCTPLQEGLLALTTKRPGDYTLQSALKLSPTVDIDRYRAAWDNATQLVPLLRTRIVDHPDLGLLQVVLREQDNWVPASHSEDHRRVPIMLCQPLARFSIVSDSQSGSSCLELTIHHAIYDGAALPLLLDLVAKIYNGLQPDIPGEIKYFIHHIQQNRESSITYWQSQLAGYHSVPFPSLPPQIQEVTADSRVQRHCVLPPLERSDVTLGTLVRAAWAIVACHRSNDNDVVFGATVSGRNAPVPGIETMIAPTIAAVPVRVRIEPQDAVSTFLQAIQDQSTEMIPFEQTGLQGIAKLNSNTYEACQFQTLLIVQPPDQDSLTESEFGEWELHSDEGAFSTYAITLNAYLAPGGINIVATFDSRVLSRWEMQKIINQFSFTIQNLSRSGGSETIESMMHLTPEDQEDIWSWNHATPTAVDRCIHDLVGEQVMARPNALAVSAWDGELTYGELDRMSTLVAQQLVYLGITPGSIVPLCFEKSLWTTVAILGALKAGGAFLMLDPSHPKNRLQSIISQTGAKVMLSSNTHYKLSSNLVDVAIEIGPGHIPEPSSKPSPLPTTDPSGPMYVVFTSGSTGLPKGVVVSHRALCSNIHYQAMPLGFQPDSRVFDFASYTFDVFVYNTAVTLATGGCICVPAESDRKNKLTGTMAAMEASLAVITPTISRLIDPTEVPTLKSLVLVGEASTQSDIERWWPYVSVINAYGPSECTTNSVVNSTSDPREGTWIGKGAGTVTWVVDPNDHNKLMPLGTIGELLLEGPLLGLGYLNDPERTAAAFIQNPQWLIQGIANHPGRQGTFYKTGDLVRYTENGSLVYIGRKDTQVKIRGQRVELGEVEYYVRQCLPEAQQAEQVIAEVIIPSGKEASPLIAVFITEEPQAGSGTSQDQPLRVLTISPDIDEKVLEHLPSYMVPAVYFGVSSLPMTATGKTDRKQLREMAGSFSVQQLADMRSQGQKRMPSSSVEKQLQALWARVLNIEPSSIGLDDSFFRLGGDSITAMQIASAARSQHLSITTGDIMRKKTIGRLSRDISTARKVPGTVALRNKEIIDQPFGLSPIQQMYLSLQTDDQALFDQSVYLQFRTRVDFSSLSEALGVLLRRHAMLRARFTRSAEGHWQQYIAGANSKSPSSSLRLVESSETAVITAALVQCRSDLDIEHGPVVRGAFINNEQYQCLFLSIHHLVVDPVSWRVLLEELEDLLQGRILPGAPPSSFQSWQAAQAEYVAAHIDTMNSQPYDSRSDLLQYWGIASSATSAGTLVTKDFTLDKEVTSRFLGGCNNAFRTQPVELLIAGLIYSFSVAFPDRQLPRIYNETHGRTAWDEAIDLSRTVGWFTNIFPVQVAQDAAHWDLFQAIRKTKDFLRRSADHWAYLPSRFYSEEAKNASLSEFPVEVLFNFLGMYQQLEREDTLFSIAETPTESEPDPRGRQRLALFEINVGVNHGSAAISVTYDRAMKHQDRIADWISQYQAVLLQMTTILEHQPLRWTLSDFPLAFTSYEDLSNFQQKVVSRMNLVAGDVVDVFPCSPLQEGILASQFKDPSSYRTCFVFEAVPATGRQTDIARIQRAWEAVVRRHALLRAQLVTDMPGSSRVFHVILKNPTPSVSVFQTEDDTIDIPGFRARFDPSHDLQGPLEHHLSICQLKNGRVMLGLEVNHAILDAHSAGILSRDLAAAYTAELDSEAPSYRDFIANIEQQSYDAARKYWTEHLADAEPCHFPSLAPPASSNSRRYMTLEIPGLDWATIDHFCRQSEVTPAIVLQTAWGLVLSRYTGSAAPCFGSLSSGRDLPLDNATDIFGPLIGMLTCQLRLDEERTVLDALQAAQSDYLKSLPHHMYPIAEVHKSLQLRTSTLFNTVLSFQKLEYWRENDNSAVSFTLNEGVDDSEVS